MNEKLVVSCWAVVIATYEQLGNWFSFLFKHKLKSRSPLWKLLGLAVGPMRMVLVTGYLNMKLNGPKAGLGFAFGSELGLFFTPCGNSPLEALRKVWTFHQAVSAHIKFTASSYYS